MDNENEQKELPDYLQHDDNGNCDITLDRALKLSNGVEQSVLRMREPTVNDQIVHDEMKGSQAVREVTMFANLCELAPDDIRSLSLKNYQRLQKAYGSFLD